MKTLQQLHGNILQDVMLYLDPVELRNLSLTCKFFNTAVSPREIGVALLRWEGELQEARNLAERWEGWHSMWHPTSYLREVMAMGERDEQAERDWVKCAMAWNLPKPLDRWAAYLDEARLPCLECFKMKTFEEFPTTDVKLSQEGSIDPNLRYKDIRRWHRDLTWGELVQWQRHDFIKSSRQCGMCHVKASSKRVWIPLGPMGWEWLVKCKACNAFDRTSECDDFPKPLRLEGQNQPAEVKMLSDDGVDGWPGTW